MILKNRHNVEAGKELHFISTEHDTSVLSTSSEPTAAVALIFYSFKEEKIFHNLKHPSAVRR